MTRWLLRLFAMADDCPSARFCACFRAKALYLPRTWHRLRIRLAAHSKSALHRLAPARLGAFDLLVVSLPNRRVALLLFDATTREPVSISRRAEIKPRLSLMPCCSAETHDLVGVIHAARLQYESPRLSSPEISISRTSIQVSFSEETPVSEGFQPSAIFG